MTPAPPSQPSQPSIYTGSSKGKLSKLNIPRAQPAESRAKLAEPATGRTATINTKCEVPNMSRGR